MSDRRERIGKVNAVGGPVSSRHPARVIVTGSIATDHLGTFSGRFVDQLVPEKLDRLSLSFLVDSLDVRRGGVAANVAFGLASLGLSPVLVGAVGDDFAEYGGWLAGNGVDTASVRVSRRHHTARFVCTTDTVGNQIASFYSGAMAEARGIELAPVVERIGGVDLVVVSPNDPEAMVRHSAECRRRGYPFAADPSQQLAAMETDQIRSLIDGARYLFTNEYEHSLVLHKTGWTAKQVRRRVGTWVTTLGPAGVRLDRRSARSLVVSAVPVADPRDPTGVGDAFRAGFLAAVAWGLPPLHAAQAGCALAAFALESIGSQEYRVDPGILAGRLGTGYGPAAAAAVSAAAETSPVSASKPATAPRSAVPATSGSAVPGTTGSA